MIAKSQNPPVKAAQTKADRVGPDWSSVVVKWFLPSVTALFGIVGYLSQSSQEALLGLRADDVSSGKYVRSAAQFLGDCVTLLIQSGASLWDEHSVSLAGHGVLLAVLTAVALGLLLAPRLPARLAAPAVRWRRPLLLSLLMLIVAIKFLLLDAPLGRLQDIILDVGVVPVQASLDAPVPPKTFGERMAKGPQSDSGRQTLTSWTEANSARLWADLVCSRVGPDSDASPLSATNTFECPLSREHSLAELKGLFLTQLWLGVLIAVLATGVLRSGVGGVLGGSVALLSLAYLLTVPYAHGKLMRSTYFDFGRIRFSEALASAGGRAPQSRPDLFGLVLSRNAAGVNLLVVTPEACAGGVAGARVTMSSVSPSQLMSVEEIYRQDVITWTALNNVACRKTTSPWSRKP